MMRKFLTSTLRRLIISTLILSFLTIIPSVLYSQKPVSPLPFNQAAVKQSTAPALQGPDASKPYFTLRFAMPIPPDNDYSNMGGTMVGVDQVVADYNHSPGFEIMPNGDALLIPYSGPGTREGGPLLRIVLNTNA